MSQFIFSRRHIQKWLTLLSAAIPLKDAANLAKRLNTGDRLATMWEVALLHSIAQEKGFEYEKALANGKEPDFKFILDGDDFENIEIYGDITTLSDEGIDKQNPIEFFMEELFRQREKAGLLDMSLSWKVYDYTKEEGFNEKRILLLPAKGNIPRVIKTKIIPLLQKWKTNAIFGVSEKIEGDGLSMTITRQKDGPYSGGGYAGYQNVNKVEDSPLYKKLKSKKTQLSAVPEEALSVLIICDGDSHVIKPSLLHSPFTADADKICGKFLEKSAAFDIILLVAIETTPYRPFNLKSDKKLSARLYVPSPKKRKKALTEPRIHAVKMRMDNWLRALPRPTLAPQNSRRRLKDNFGPTPMGGYTMSGNTIELSSRRITELLAGIATTDDWKKDFEGSQPNPLSFFIRKRLEGRMITSIEVKSQPDSDDDTLVITYGEPDSAISNFKAP